MKEPNIMMGIPLADDMFADVRVAFWCYQEAGKNGWTLKCERGGSAARNKNVIANAFMSEKNAGGDYTHIFFLNNDTWPDEGAVADLIACDKDIVSGITPAFTYGFHWMGQIEKNVKIELDEAPTKLTPAARAGGPAMLIKRKVFEAIKFPWFDFEQIEIGVEKSEDYAFCDKAISQGFEVWIEPKVICHHNHRGMDILTMAKSIMEFKKCQS